MQDTSEPKEQEFLFEHISAANEEYKSMLVSLQLRHTKNLTHKNSRLVLVAMTHTYQIAQQLLKQTTVMLNNTTQIALTNKTKINEHIVNQDLAQQHIAQEFHTYHHAKKIFEWYQENVNLLNKIIAQSRQWRLYKDLSTTQTANAKTILSAIDETINILINNTNRTTQTANAFGQTLSDFDIQRYYFSAIQMILHTDIMNAHKEQPTKKNVKTFYKHVTNWKLYIQLLKQTMQEIPIPQQQQVLQALQKITDIISMTEQSLPNLQKPKRKDLTHLQTYISTLNDVYGEFCAKVKLLNK